MTYTWDDSRITWDFPFVTWDGALIAHDAGIGIQDAFRGQKRLLSEVPRDEARSRLSAKVLSI